MSTELRPILHLHSPQDTGLDRSAWDGLGAPGRSPEPSAQAFERRNESKPNGINATINQPALATTVRQHFESHEHFRGRTGCLRFEVDEKRTVVIGGVVPSFFLKQLAQEVARQIPGVRRVKNRIDVLGPHVRSERSV